MTLPSHQYGLIINKFKVDKTIEYVYLLKTKKINIKCYHNIEDISQNPEIIKTNFKDMKLELIDFIKNYVRNFFFFLFSSSPTNSSLKMLS